MTPRLDRGRLRPPASVREAREREAALQHEVSSIAKQLENPERRAHFNTEDSYRAWETRAREARKLLRAELNQLRAWLAAADHPDFHAVYELLKTLREEEVEFDERELALLARIGKIFE
jgi:hypothetical protein